LVTSISVLISHFLGLLLLLLSLLFYHFLSYRGSLSIKSFSIDALTVFTLAASAFRRLPVVFRTSVVSHPALAIFTTFVGNVLSKVAPYWGRTFGLERNLDTGQVVSWFRQSDLQKIMSRVSS
jgi:hypothetical protein